MIHCTFLLFVNLHITFQEGLDQTARDNILVVNICALGLNVGAKKQSCKYHRVAKTWFSSQHKQRRYEHTVHFWYTFLKNESLLHPLKHG